MLASLGKQPGAFAATVLDCEGHGVTQDRQHWEVELRRFCARKYSSGEGVGTEMHALPSESQLRAAVEAAGHYYPLHCDISATFAARSRLKSSKAPVGDSQLASEMVHALPYLALTLVHSLFVKRF